MLYNYFSIFRHLVPITTILLASLIYPSLCLPQPQIPPMMVDPVPSVEIHSGAIIQPSQSQPASIANHNNKLLTNADGPLPNQPTKPPLVQLTRLSSTILPSRSELMPAQGSLATTSTPIITMDVNQRPTLKTTLLPRLMSVQTTASTNPTTTATPGFIPEGNSHPEHIFDASTNPQYVPENRLTYPQPETTTNEDSHVAQPSEVRPYSADPSSENAPIAPEESPTVSPVVFSNPSTTSAPAASTSTTTTTTALPVTSIEPAITSAPQSRPSPAAARLPEPRVLDMVSSTRAPQSSSSSSHQWLTPKSNFKCKSNDDCHNEGLCSNGACYCKSGFTGLACLTNVDECGQFAKSVGEPACLNNGTCIDEIDNFRCECQPGFIGDRCQESIDMCANSPCLNGAECINHRTNYTCQCRPGWEGRHCDVNIDECSTNPCQNNGTCHDLVNDYKCDCGNSGFVGQHCEINYDDCASKPCGFAAIKCVDLIGDYECVCHEGFTGKKCDIDIDECQTNPCENNGTCVQKSMNIHHFTHNSTVDLTMYQDVNRDRNSTMPSANFSHYAGYTCECLEEYYGERCEEKKKCFTKSALELCNHQQAECVNVDNSYECLINASFDGSGQNYASYRVLNPDFKLKEVYVRYRSLFGGTIISFDTNQLTSQITELQLNGSGPHLSGPLMFHEEFKSDEYMDGNEREIRLTLDAPLEIRGITLTRPSSERPFKGCIMQIRLNNQLLPFVEYGTNQTFELSRNVSNLEVGQCRTCFEKDCLNGGHCEFQEGFDHCACPNAFTGHFCERDVDECQKNFNLCLNGGTCENFHGGYKCKCKEGYRGEKCQDIADYCKAKQPCVYGTCKNVNPSQGNYQCDCPSAYFGKRCDHKRDCINECHSHHAHCVNNVTCACLPGKREERIMCEYVSRCEQVEGELCLNGGACKNLDIGGYHCHCLEPFYGPVCQFISEKPQVDIILLVVITCVCLLLAACAVISLVIFRSVRKARATRGTYSPSTQEKFGNSASDLLKPPQRERLI